MAGQSQANLDQFESYFKRADLDHDGRISGNEAVGFFQGSNLTKQVLAQIWVISDQNRTGFLGRQEFYNMLKLVTVAQSKRELTPDIVKAALYGPASAKIPAPQINLAPTSTQQVNVVTANLSSPSFTAVTTTGSQVIGPRGSQGFASQQNVVMRPHIPLSPSSNIQTHEGVLRPPLPPNGRNIQVSYPPNGVVRPVASTLVSQMGVTNSMRPVAQDQRAIPASGFPPSTQVAKGSSLETKISGAVKENGHASDSLFGDVYSATAPQTTQGSTVVASYSSLPAPSAMIPGSQLSVKSSQLESFSNTPQQPMGSQHQHGHLPVQSSLKASGAFPVGGINPNGQSQASWPRMTQMDVQKYAKVFMQVDTDRDGKITGEQARNLFLSWRQPQEVLKQVWDLSDQDNDSMLSLREFCISLYLMERYREGHPLPKTLPSSVIDETLFTGSSYPPGSQGNGVLRTSPGFQQPQIIKSTRAVAFGGASKPPRPVPISQHEDVMQPSRQKPKVPVLEKHLLDQLSSEEQSSLNSKFQEATEADKKVAELEKEILDAKEKIQFYHAKMQELILYKSRCDNRLNEIVERVSADKREVDSLAKKYEEKYRQAGDVASKLTIEEATFRHIQEKKMELYRAIVKLEQEGSADVFQERASHIQLDLEELVKSLNERCKTYGLRTKPTSLVELPFGWQPGIQGAAADWDENWDKFEDEGFTLVKELTLDVQNVIAPPKPKSTIVGDKEALRDVGVAKLSSDADVIAAKVQNNDERIAENGVNVQGEEQTLNSSDSPTKSNGFDTRSRDFESSHLSKEIGFDGSPHASHSEHEVTESVFSGNKAFNEPSWGTFDSHYDTDAAWDLNHVTTKDSDAESQRDTSLFGSDEWGLQPIRTGSTYADNAPPSKQGPFFDSVPSTPLYNSGSSPQADNMFQGKSLFFDSVPSTPMYNSGSSAQADNVFQNKSTFFDSVPSTPIYNSGSSTQADNIFQNKSTFFDSVPSTPMYNSDSFAQADNVFQKSTFFDSVPSTPMYKADGSPREDNLFQRKSPFAFADSVPGTPMSNHVTSPRRYSEASEDRAFDSFSRFDSFNTQDGGLFAPHDSSLSRFDSMRSSRDAASLSRFDSMRSTKESEYDPGVFAPRDSFARFDSFRSTADSDYSFGLFPPQDSISRFDSMSSSKASDYNHGFASFDNSDPFGSSDPFKTSFENQTPRKNSDGWKAS